MKLVLKFIPALLLFFTFSFFASGCFHNLNDISSVEQLQKGIREDFDQNQFDAVIEKSQRLLSLQPNPVDRLWALAFLLESARNQNTVKPIPKAVDDVFQTLPLVLAQGKPFDPNLPPKVKEAYDHTDIGLREAHKILLKKLEEQPDQSELVQTFDKISQNYPKYFGESIAASQVIWNQAEWMRISGHPMVALYLYEEMIAKDLEGNHIKEAQNYIQTVWKDLLVAQHPAQKPPTPVDWPDHAQKWAEELNQKINQPNTKDSMRKFLSLQLAHLYLAYGPIDQAYQIYEKLIDDPVDKYAIIAAKRFLAHAYALGGPEAYKRMRNFLSVQNKAQLWKEEDFRKDVLTLANTLLKYSPQPKVQAYPLFQDIIQSADDPVSVQAAKDYLNYAAQHEKRYQFRLIRKSLQANKYLWSQVDFRILVFRLKDEVEK